MESGVRLESKAIQVEEYAFLDLGLLTSCILGVGGSERPFSFSGSASTVCSTGM